MNLFMGESKKNEGFVILAGESNPELAEAISNILQKRLYRPIIRFKDGEAGIKPEKMPNLRNLPVFILQPTCPPTVDKSLMELLIMIDAAKRASAGEITAVVPYFGYSRQDKKDQPRVPITASLVANQIATAGADRILTLDIHALQSQGFVPIPWDNLFGNFALIPELKKKNLQDMVIVSPDERGVKDATKYARLLEVRDMAIVQKERNPKQDNQPRVLSMIGNVEGKNALIVDDMIDSGGTLFNAVDYLLKSGAKSVSAVATHGVFSGDFLERLNKSPITEIMITDTVRHSPEILAHPKIKVVSVAPLIAKAVLNLFNGDSLSEELILKPETEKNPVIQP